MFLLNLRNYSIKSIHSLYSASILHRKNKIQYFSSLLQNKTQFIIRKYRKTYSSQIKCLELDLYEHEPVMYNEVLQFLDLLPGSTIIDMTFGSGGHSVKILESVSDVKIFALDRDPVAYECAKKLSEKYPNQVIPLLGCYSELPKLMKEQNVGLNSIDAIVFEFGCSRMQLKDASRGLSMLNNGPLDMRMSGNRNVNEPTAANVLEHINETDLIRILKMYGKEKRAKCIAQAIIETRYNFRSLKTINDLMHLVESVIGIVTYDKLDLNSHPAFKTFQALRAFVNNEFNEINYALMLAAIFLKEEGKLITIAYTILEDMIVKSHLTGNITDQLGNKLNLKYRDCNRVYCNNDLIKITSSSWKMLHKHILKPTEVELELNPWSRNAKLRALEKCTAI